MARPSNTQEKREDLISKATICFRKYGYDKTSLDDIAKAMKLNKASLYYYIKNKEELFLEILLSEATESMNQLLVDAKKINQPLEKIHFFFNNRVDVYIKLIKLNSISKTTILELQNQFFMVYEKTSETEFNFIKSILIENKLTTYKGKKIDEFTKLLFEVANAIKHESVLLGDVIEGNSETLKLLKNKIKQTINLFINSTHKI
jgi:AcrR family transcriptional regulator